MLQKVAKICLVMFSFFIFTFATCHAVENVSSRIRVPGTTKWHLSSGYFLPNEGDLDGNGLLGLGFEYTSGKDTLFGDFSFSSTKPNLSIPLGNVDNYILQTGYMTNFGKWEKTRIGGGLQIHQMNFGGTSLKKTRLTVVGIMEYDLIKRVSLRLSSSQSVKKGTIRFGGMSFIMNYTLN